MTHLPREANNLYENLGAGLFEDVSGPTGLGPSSLGHTGFGTGWFDVDNDGWLDILVINGAIEAIQGREDELFPYDEPNLLFRNIQNGRFDDVIDKGGAAFDLSEVSRGAAFGDIDNDGDTDVVVVHNSGAARPLINEVGSRQHWNRSESRRGHWPPGPARGARRRDPLRHDVVATRACGHASYASANDPRVLVGLGASVETPRVCVVWPSGQVEEWTELAIDRYTTLTEGQGTNR